MASERKEDQKLSESYINNDIDERGFKENASELAAASSGSHDIPNELRDLHRMNYEMYKQTFEQIESSSAKDEGTKSLSSTELNSIFKELQSLVVPVRERLTGGGIEDTLLKLANTKFCCSPSARCFTCQDGAHSTMLHRNPAETPSTGACFWRVPNDCPCFSANSSGELQSLAPNQYPNTDINRTSGSANIPK